MNEPTTTDETLPPAPLPGNVKVLGLASLLNDAASEMIYPLLPHFLISVLHGNRFHLGIIEGIADSVASLTKLWSGAQSDQSGRRKGFIFAGYSMPALVRPLLWFVVAPWQLFAVRVFDRIGKGVRSSPRDALIADSTAAAGRGRAFGFQRAMDNLGAAIGPLLAAGFLWLWPTELRTLFLVALVPGLAVLALLVLGLREQPASQLPREPVHMTLKPFGSGFRIYLVALVVFTLGNSSDAFLLVRASEVGVAPVLLPLLWCACHVAKSTSNVFFGRAVDRFGSRPALVLGWLCFAGVYGAFGLSSSQGGAWACFAAYGIVQGLIEPAERALVAQLVGAERRGLAYGWYNAAIGVAALPSSLVFGLLYQRFGPLVAFAWGAGLALFAALLLLGIAARPDEKSP